MFDPRCLIRVCFAAIPLVCGLIGAAAGEGAKGPTIFAAASLKTALDAISAAWQAHGHPAPIISYGASGALAKQIQTGAPADLFISADQKWMDVVEKAGLLRPHTRIPLVGNLLVLVAPKDATVELKITKGFDLAGALGDGKLAMCTLATCPAGQYGKQALESLAAFKAVESKIVQTDNVRAALELVARGEARMGIVYATDVKAEPKVRIVATFPDATHDPIVYPVAVLKDATSPDAAMFESFLRGGEAIRVLLGQGFFIVRK